jgi:vacuolar-type H+-ATPase subunit H
MEKKFDGKISNIEKLLQSEISTAVELVTAAQGDARDIRNELRKDMNELLDQINSVDKRSRLTEQEIRTSQRTAENDVRTLIQHAEDRFDGKRTAIESDAQRRAEAMDVKLTELEERLRDMLQKALNNPLTGQ